MDAIAKENPVRFEIRTLVHRPFAVYHLAELGLFRFLNVRAIFSEGFVGSTKTDPDLRLSA